MNRTGTTIPVAAYLSVLPKIAAVLATQLSRIEALGTLADDVALAEDGIDIEDCGGSYDPVEGVTDTEILIGQSVPKSGTAATFSLLTQVAGRAGRGTRGGEVIVQTSLPNHYVIVCAQQHDFLGFAGKELAARETPRYPPFSRLINIVLSGVEEEPTQEAAAEAADWLRGLAAAQRLEGIDVVGAAPCPIDRIRGRWRWHLLLRSDSAALLGRVGRYFAERFELSAGRADLRIAIDRDPVALL